jgi:hypothetical protein
MKKITLVLFALTFLFFVKISSAQDAVYKIEFVSNWSVDSHPTDFPIGLDHWSALVGTTHNTNISFFEIGQLATNGVEKVAENGNNTTIKQEINTSINNGNAYEVIEGSGLSSGLGTITIENVNVAIDFPYLSLITMIAPSPDWVAQINSINLTDVNNNWEPLISIDVYATDAGTDSGTTYNSSNMDMNPANNISSYENTAPFSDQIIGSFNITLIEVLDLDDELLQNSILVYPNPSYGEIHIDNFENHILEKVEIYSVEGKRIAIMPLSSNQKKFTVNSLKSGIYFLKIISNKGSVIKKVIVK